MINFRKKFASENEFKQFKKVYDQIKPDQMQNIHILSKGHLMCPKCKIKYSFKELIENSNATIYRTGSVKDNQDINGLICFKCENFSEWKKLPEEECIWEENGGIKYLATYPITENIKNKIVSHATKHKLNNIINKINRIKIVE
jgi:glutaredoxin-related protein